MSGPQRLARRRDATRRDRRRRRRRRSYLDGVVEDVREGVEADGSRGKDARRAPALPGGPLHLQHVVGDDLAEAELIVWAFWKRTLAPLHLQLGELTRGGGRGKARTSDVSA